MRTLYLLVTRTNAWKRTIRARSNCTWRRGGEEGTQKTRPSGDKEKKIIIVCGSSLYHDWSESKYAHSHRENRRSRSGTTLRGTERECVISNRMRDAFGQQTCSECKPNPRGWFYPGVHSQYPLGKSEGGGERGGGQEGDDKGGKYGEGWWITEARFSRFPMVRFFVGTQQSIRKRIHWNGAGRHHSFGKLRAITQFLPLLWFNFNDRSIALTTYQKHPQSNVSIILLYGMLRYAVVLFCGFRPRNRVSITD